MNQAAPVIYSKQDHRQWATLTCDRESYLAPCLYVVTVQLRLRDGTYHRRTTYVGECYYTAWKRHYRAGCAVRWPDQ